MKHNIKKKCAVHRPAPVENIFEPRGVICVSPEQRQIKDGLHMIRMPTKMKRTNAKDAKPMLKHLSLKSIKSSLASLFKQSVS